MEHCPLSLYSKQPGYDQRSDPKGYKPEYVHQNRTDAFDEFGSPAGITMNSTDGDDDQGILEYLLESGADVEAEYITISNTTGERHTWNLLRYALQTKKTNSMCLLLKYGAKLMNEANLLKRACYHTSLRLLYSLLDRDLELLGDEMLPIHWAMTATPLYTGYGLSASNVRTHITHTQGLNIKDHLVPFCPNNQLEFIKALLQNGCDPNKADPESLLIAGHMVSHGHKVELYKLLLTHGWDIHTTDVEGWTALHYAAFGNDVEAVKFLIDEGSRVNFAGRRALYLPLHAVASHDYFRNRSLFSEYQLNTCYIYPNVYNDSKIRIIEVMLELGVDLNSTTIGRMCRRTVIELLCCPCFYVFYKTIVWLLKHPITLPFRGDIVSLTKQVGDEAAFLVHGLFNASRISM